MQRPDFKKTFQSIGFLSYENAAYRWRNGYLSDREWRAYLFLWHWTAIRFTSDPQQSCYDHCGHAFVIRRINRVRAWCGLDEI